MLQSLRGSRVLTLLCCYAVLKLRSGVPSEDIKAKLERRARNDVRSFSRLKLDDVDVGLNMLRDLEKHPDGIEQVVGDHLYEPREIAAEIRSKNAHAVLWHPEMERYLFASEMHREAAKTVRHSRNANKPTADSAC